MAVAGCHDQGPQLRDGGTLPLFSHLASNPMFGFIAPVPPGTTVPGGDFHAFAAPVLEICREETSGCTLLVTATLSAGVTNSGTSSISAITIGDEQYQTNWSGLNALRNANSTHIYRIKVRAAPVAGAATQFMGQARVTLGSSTDPQVIAVSGNTLPIKFVIRVGAFCEGQDCTEQLVSGPTQILLSQQGSNLLGIDVLDHDFIDCSDPNDPCPSEIVITVSRYRGPDRCIDTGTAYPGVHTIQWESCVTIRSSPWGIKLKNVMVGLCIDPRADTYALSGHLRLLKITEDEAGAVMPDRVVDLNAELTEDFFFNCGPEWQPTLGAAPGQTDLLSRLAQRASRALRPLATLLGPSPLHARRRGNGPMVASLEDLSRLGSVLPVRAEFDPRIAAGLQNTLLPASSQPWARVLGTRFPNSTYAVSGDPSLSGDRGVSGVPVSFAVVAGGGSHPAAAVLTNAQGFATASWTLGSAAQNPQQLQASVGFPHGLIEPGYPNGFQNGSFANPTQPWSTHTFTGMALEYAVFFSSPLGSGGGTGPNVTSITPRVRVCGPLQDPANASAAPGQTCIGNVHTTLPAPVLKSGVWETAWKSDKLTVSDRLYRIEVVVGSGDIDALPAIGAVLARRGGGGGGIDPVGTYQFQNGSNIPVKFVVNLAQ